MVEERVRKVKVIDGIKSKSKLFSGRLIYERARRLWISVQISFGFFVSFDSCFVLFSLGLA